MSSFFHTQFKLNQKIDENKFYTLFQGYDCLTEKDVLIKVFHQDIPISKESLLQLPFLKHPNILPVLDAGYIPENGFFIAVPKIKGETLLSHLSQAKNAFISIAFQLATALAFLHHHRFIHRDISLNNLIVTPEGRVLLADLDFCWSLSIPFPEKKLVGTFPYLKPELVKGKEYYSFQSDLYAVGIVLLELYSGEKIEQNISQEKLNKRIFWIEDFNIQRIIKKLLSKEEKPYATGEDFLCDLLLLLSKNKSFLEQVPLEYLGGSNLWEERKEERILKGLLAQVEDSKSRIALLIGEKKSGKTTLLKNFLLRNKSPSGRYIFISASNFFDFLKSIKKQFSFLLKKEEPLSFEEISRWEERRSRDYLISSQSQKFSLFDQILNCLKKIIPEDNLKFFIFVVDDLQLCDSLIIECLQYLIKNSSDLPILYLFSTTKLKNTFDPKSSFIYIKPYSLEFFKKSVYFPPLNKEQFFEFLYKKSSGLPFYFLEIMSEFLKNKSTSLDLLITGATEDNFTFVRSPILLDLYRKKISRLTPLEKEIFEFSSLFSDNFSSKQISLFKTYPNIEKSLVRLIEAGLISEAKEGEYISVQPWKDLAYNQIPQGKKQQLHTLLADHAIREGQPNSTIAFHFLHSNEKKKGIPYALKAAEETKSKLNYEDGLNLLNQYSPVINSIKDNKIKIKYFSLKGQLNLLLGNFSDSKKEFEKALKFSFSKKEEEGLTRLQLGESLYGNQEYERALEILTENKYFLERNSSKETVKIQVLNDYLLAKNLWLTGKINEAIEHLKEASEKAFKIDPVLAAKGILELGYFFLMKGERKEAEKYLYKGREISQQNKKSPEYGLSQLYLAYLEKEKGDLRESLTLLKSAYQSFSKIHDYFSQAKVSCDLGNYYLHLENWQEAKKWFSKSENLFNRINNPRGKTLARFNLGEVALYEGNWDFAEKVFRESLEFEQKSGNQWGIAYDLNSLGYVHFLKGDFETAEKELKESKKIFHSLEALQEETDCWVKLAELYIERKDYSQAQECINNGLRVINKANSQKLNIQLLILEGLIAFYQNDFIKAERIANECLRKAEKVKVKSLLAKSLVLKGKVFKNKNKRVSLVAFAEAIKIFKSLKNSYWLAEAFIDYYLSFPELIKKPSGRNNIVWATETFKNLGSFRYNLGEELITRYLPKHVVAHQVKEEANAWIGRSLTAIEEPRSPSDLLDRLLALILNEIPAERAITFLMDNEGNIVYKKSNEGLVEERDFSFSLIKRSMIEKKAFMINNLKTDPQFKDNESVIIHNIDSVICLPLTIEGRTAGVIYLDRQSGFTPFSTRDLEFLIAISKPISLILKNSIEFEKLRDKLKEKFKFPLITHSPKMEKIFSIVEKVKNLDIPVMILGESGTGKELIARLIHSYGSRKNGEFVAVNCSALPENLLEAELFGYVKGAFTGANRDKKGLIEEANEGTFFLDEIGDLPLPLQSKLLRVLQEKEIRRIGENKTRPINARFISATNKNLDKEVAKGNFREDLYYRLKVIPIEIPPLRERREDIPLLADYFLKKYGKQMGKEDVHFSSEAMEILTNYFWPGNIRELENEIQRLLVFLGEGNIIRKEHLSNKIVKETEGEVFYELGHNLAQAREQFEKKFILQALARNKYKKSKTAQELGLSRQGLLKLMKKHNLI